MVISFHPIKAAKWPKLFSFFCIIFWYSCTCSMRNNLIFIHLGSLSFIRFKSKPKSEPIYRGLYSYSLRLFCWSVSCVLDCPSVAQTKHPNHTHLRFKLKNLLFALIKASLTVPILIKLYFRMFYIMVKIHNLHLKSDGIFHPHIKMLHMWLQQKRKFIKSTKKCSIS